jgi:hypothetical protein
VLASGEVIVDEELYLIGSDGRRSTFTCSCAPFYDDQGRVVGAVSVAQQAAVAELGLTALEEGGLQRLMDDALTLVCGTLGVPYAKVDELLPGGQQLLVGAGAGWGHGVVGSCVMPAGPGSPSGYALSLGWPPPSAAPRATSG